MLSCGKCRREPPDGALFCPFCGAAIVPPQEPGKAIDPLVGQTIRGTYFVQEKLGSGGIGQVYKATQINLDRPVALKLLRPRFHSEPTLVQRFHREARASSKLHHPNVIAVLDFGQAEDGTLFMAMEYLPGRNLLTLLREESPLGERRVVHLAAQVLSALAEAHGAGIVHRDLKPANVMVESRRDEPDFVKVVDFGIAQIQEPGDGDGQLTQAGLICGTPDYVSPEQASLLPIDARSDLYSVGVILYEMLTGRHPFDAATPPAMLLAHVVQQPPPLAERCPPGRAVSPALESLVMRALAKAPADRFHTAEEMRRELLECPLDPALAEDVASASRAMVPPSERETPASHRSGSASLRGPLSPETPPLLAPLENAAAQGPAPGHDPHPREGEDETLATVTPPSGPPNPAEYRPRRRLPARFAVLAALAVIVAAAGSVFLSWRGHGERWPSEAARAADLEGRGSPPRAAPTPQQEPAAAPAGPAGARPAAELGEATASAPEPRPDLPAASPVPATPAAEEPVRKRGATSDASRKPPRASARAKASGAAAAPSRAQERKRPSIAAAPPPRSSSPPAPVPGKASPPRATEGDAAQAAALPFPSASRREAFVTREVMAYQQSFGDPELKGRGRGLLGKARWILEPNGTLVFAPADEAPGFFPLTVRATRDGNRVRFEGARTAPASGGPGYVRISGDLVVAGEPVLTVDLEFGRALGADGARLEPTYRARARLRLALE
jgi:serine/threonine protein kinase